MKVKKTKKLDLKSKQHYPWHPRHGGGVGPQPLGWALAEGLPPGMPRRSPAALAATLSQVEKGKDRVTSPTRRTETTQRANNPKTTAPRGVPTSRAGVQGGMDGEGQTCRPRREARLGGVSTPCSTRMMGYSAVPLTLTDVISQCRPHKFNFKAIFEYLSGKKLGLFCIVANN